MKWKRNRKKKNKIIEKGKEQNRKKNLSVCVGRTRRAVAITIIMIMKSC
jgi:hypothetical protein